MCIVRIVVVVVVVVGNYLKSTKKASNMGNRDDEYDYLFKGNLFFEYNILGCACYLC